MAGAGVEIRASSSKKIGDLAGIQLSPGQVLTTDKIGINVVTREAGVLKDFVLKS